jgi:transcription antitermination factor NusG
MAARDGPKRYCEALPDGMAESSAMIWSVAQTESTRERTAQRWTAGSTAGAGSGQPRGEWVFFGWLFFWEFLVSDWVVARVSAQRERAVARCLGRRGCLSFAPRYVRQERGEACETYLYPSYSFVLAPSQWYFLLDVDGVLGILADRRSHQPWRSSYLDRRVESLMREADSSGIVPAPERPRRFVHGQRVRAIDGLFSGMSGV